MKRSLVLAALLGGGSLLVLALLKTGSGQPVYSFSVARFLAKRVDGPVRVQGTLVHDSLCKVEADCGYRFSLVDTQQANSGTPTPSELLSVSYAGCMLPDTFRDMHGLDVQITVEGQRCQSCHDLEASSIIAKCPGGYWMHTDGGASDSHQGPYTPRETPRCQSRM